MAQGHQQLPTTLDRVELDWIGLEVTFCSYGIKKEHFKVFMLTFGKAEIEIDDKKFI